MKQISIIGSTGSIGLSTLQVLRAHPGKFKIITLAAKSNAEELYKQAIEFKPKLVCLYEKDKTSWLAAKLKSYGIKVAQLAGLPDRVIRAAQEKLNELETA